MSSIPSQLPDECRAKCLDCHGHGTASGIAINSCLACQSGPMACPAHMCKACSGSGLVCPQCRGMRFVRVADWDNHFGGNGRSDMERCRKCCEGNNVSSALEREVIRRYMFRWRTLVAEAAARGEIHRDPQTVQREIEAAEYKARVPSRQPTLRRNITEIAFQKDEDDVSHG